MNVMSKNSPTTEKALRTKSKKAGNPIVAFITRDLSAWILLIPMLICVFYFILRPQILSIYWSFHKMVMYKPQGFVGLQNYITVLSRPDFLQTLKNTVTYVVYSMIIGFPLPFILALIMNELVHFRKLTRVLVYFPGVMPAMATSLLWVFIYNPAAGGLMNMILGKVGIAPYQWLQDSRFTILWIVVSMTWNGCGGTALYYFAAMQGINRELYEAALIDGAGFWKRVRIVTLPYMYGMLILFGVKQIIGVFNVMEQVLQMTGGGPNNASVTLGLLNYRYAFENGGKNAQYALALGVMMFIGLSIFAVLYFFLDKKIQANQM